MLMVRVKACMRYQILEETKNVLSLDLKVSIELAALTLSGKEFQL